jgi:hypothetical protein
LFSFGASAAPRFSARDRRWGRDDWRAWDGLLSEGKSYLSRLVREKNGAVSPESPAVFPSCLETALTQCDCHFEIADPILVDMSSAIALSNGPI